MSIRNALIWDNFENICQSHFWYSRAQRSPIAPKLGYLAPTKKILSEQTSLNFKKCKSLPFETPIINKRYIFFCPQNWSKVIFLDVKKLWKNNVPYGGSRNVHFSNLFFNSSTYTNIMCCSTNSKSILTIQLTTSIKEPKVLQIRIQFSIPLRNFSFNIK